MASGTMDIDKEKWSNKMLSIVHSLNSFHLEGSSKPFCKAFIVDGKKIGRVPPYVFKELENFKNVFIVKTDCIELHESLKTFTERTNKIQEVMKACRDQGTFISLKGWRNEMYIVTDSFGKKPLFHVERTAASLFGIQQYGVHLNGYKRDGNNRLHMWIARRSYEKPTFPGKLDQIAAGGLAAGTSIQDTLIKECKEEARMPEKLARNAISVGAVSYCYEDERGIFPEVEFVYDLELPEDFIPTIGDDEVQEFFCWPIDKVKEKIATGDFKPNCAIIILDFLIRHGVVPPDSEPNFVNFITGVHCPLP